ncbi:hypothetical protein WJX84_000207 [Apatococcus fuscideae]|uniref:Uncharacterized protein n=1 Tax=Apatococcus fuscideae TaxID=2026836 RepID=A0AAW1SIC1_9CHLO
MWNQLSSFAADIRERAEHAARDAGFEDQVSRARQQVDALAGSVLSLEPSPTKDEGHQQGQERRASAEASRQVSGAFMLPDTEGAGPSDAEENGWDMDEIPLGENFGAAAEQALTQSPRKPMLSRPSPEKPGQDLQLQKRVAALEKEIRTCQADLQDCQDRVKTERQGKAAAQKDLRDSKAKVRVLEQNLQRSQQQAESLQEQVDEVTRELELGKKGVDAAENALQAQQDEAESLRKQLASALMAKLQQAAVPSEASQASALMTSQLADAQAMEMALREENQALKDRIRSFSMTTPVKSAPVASSAASPEGIENGHGDAGLQAPSPVQSPGRSQAHRTLHSHNSLQQSQWQTQQLILYNPLAMSMLRSCKQLTLTFPVFKQR